MPLSGSIELASADLNFRHVLQLHDQTGALPLTGSEDSDSSTSITWEAVSRFIESEWSKGIDRIRLTG